MKFDNIEGMGLGAIATKDIEPSELVWDAGYPSECLHLNRHSASFCQSVNVQMYSGYNFAEIVE